MIQKRKYKKPEMKCFSLITGRKIMAGAGSEDTGWLTPTDPGDEILDPPGGNSFLVGSNTDYNDSER